MARNEKPLTGDETPSNNTVVDRGAGDEPSSIDEKPRHSLHSDRKHLRFGSNSIDAPRQPNGSWSNTKDRARSLTTLNDDPQFPQSPPPTHAPTSTQSPRQHMVRSSTEFDRRFDGPFGRPSLVMTRQRSSQQQRPSGDYADGVFTGNQDAGVVAETESAPQVLEPEPPPLNYTLHTRYRSIFIFWFFIVFDSVVMPIALYYGLWYGVGPGSTSDDSKEIMSANTVFSIVTAAIGGASILEYFIRFWRLWKKGSTCRVIGARRWYLDAFHWNYTLAWLIIMIELIV